MLLRSIIVTISYFASEASPEKVSHRIHGIRSHFVLEFRVPQWKLNVNGKTSLMIIMHMNHASQSNVFYFKDTKIISWL